MSGPWYEQEQPDAEYVRNHQLGLWKLKVGSNQLSKSTIELIEHILLIYIPDGTTGFGSYRGYNSFGLDKRLSESIHRALTSKLHARTQAMKYLRRHFAPLVVHHLYKPEGIGYKNVKENTNIGTEKSAYTLNTIKQMRKTIEVQRKWPNNFNGDSQLKMIERFKYLLNMSDELNLQTESQKRTIIQDKEVVSECLRKQQPKD
jgi:hypothetical protein